MENKRNVRHSVPDLREESTCDESASTRFPPARPRRRSDRPRRAGAGVAGGFRRADGPTVATVAATWVDLGGWNLWIALGIATVKASLVALYFMHLRYDNPFYALIFVTALVFLGCSSR